MDRRAVVNIIMFYTVVIVLLFFCLGFFSHFLLNYKNIETFNEGPVWTVLAPDGKLYTQVDLVDNDLKIFLNEGEHLYLMTNIDDSYKGEVMARVYVRQAGIRASLNGDTIFRYMTKAEDRHRFVGSGFQFITVPSVEGNRQLQLDVIGSRGKPINAMPSVVMTRAREGYTHFLSEHMLVMFCGVFLLILGILITGISIVCFAIDYEYYPLVIMGVIGILAGLWSVSNIKSLEIFSLNMAVNTYIEYLALYLLPLPVLQFIVYRHEKEHRRIWPMRVAAGIEFAFTLLVVILHAAGVVLITDTLTEFHILALVCLISVIASGVKPMKKLEKYEYFYLLAFVSIVLFSIFFIIRFQIIRLSHMGTTASSFTYLTLGMLMFEMLLLFGYLSYMHSRVVSRAEHAILEQLAYEDRMTGLCNRAKGEILLHKLDDRSGGEPYAIVNFDMNGLKRTNDSLGHYAGDDMLVKFAEILSKVFTGIGTAVRMSGDEFIVIVRGKDQVNRVDHALQQLIVMEAEVSTTEDYIMDAAYGVAYSMEFLEPKAERVYRLADQRMYEMKVATKKGRE